MKRIEYEIYLLTPSNYIPLFVSATDRAYFSKPVRVTLSHSTLDKTLYVTDPRRGETYPVNPKHLKNQFQLSKRQIAASAV